MGPSTCTTSTGESIGSNTLTVNDSNTTATPGSPYMYLTHCNGGNMSNNANDVWYTFVAPLGGYGVDISVTNATFANPNIALWTGPCDSLAGLACTVGSAGAANLHIPNSINPGQTYYVQVSGAAGQTGKYTLKVYSFLTCQSCVQGSTLKASPMPVANGYAAGQTVNFCFHVDQYQQINTNWFHGVQVYLGAGWDVASLTATPFTGCDGNGNWAYYPQGDSSTATGQQFHAGFYYDQALSAPCGCLDGKPGNNFGDNCSGPITSTNWNFCFSVKVLGTSTPGTDLSVRIGTTADGTSGSWSNAGCANDSANNFLFVCNSGTTGMTNALHKNSLGIYPNPASGKVVITVPQGSGSVIIYNALGDAVMTIKTENTTETVDVGRLPAGIYIISAGGRTARLVKQ